MNLETAVRAAAGGDLDAFAEITRAGVTVGLAESLRVCREILDGVHDNLPAGWFNFTAGLDAVLANAAARSG
jgi:hypothetical protein